MAFLEQGHRYYWAVAEISSQGGKGAGRGDSLARISPLLALKLLIRWGGKGAGDVWTCAVSERVFPFAAPLGLIKCFVGDAVQRLGSG